MNHAKYIKSNDLARMLSVTSDEIFETARTQKHLPFAISTKSPRQLMVRDKDFLIWREAVLEKASDG
jgi:hypothetical protein